ncbi:type 1 glutamine amidotransferase domain-containing protein [soil metagenome]
MAKTHEAEVRRTLRDVTVAVLVTDLFEEEELASPKQALEEQGARVVVLSLTSDPVRAARHDEPTQDSYRVDRLVGESNAEEFDALLLPGGVGNADKLRLVPEAQAFVQAFQATGRPLAVICHGPWLLVSSGLVKGRTLTSFATLQDDIRNAGGTWVDKEVVRDGNWVSSRKPADLPAFNREFISMIKTSVADKIAVGSPTAV